MIAHLAGRILRKSPESVIVDVQGVGYEVAVPLSTAAALSEAGADARLHIHTHLREDSLSLFGFATEVEKDLFELLIGVSGIGPKLALAVLSSLSAGAIVASIRASDEAALCRIPGIGKKTAARLCLELKDRIARIGLPADGAGSPAQPAGGTNEDAVSALVNLGYKRQQAEEAVQGAQRGRAGAPRVEDLIREALHLLTKR